MNCNRALKRALINNIGIHRTQALADFKLRITRVDIDETMSCDEKRNSLILTQINNGDIVNVVRKVLIL